MTATRTRDAGPTRTEIRTLDGSGLVRHAPRCGCGGSWFRDAGGSWFLVPHGGNAEQARPPRDAGVIVRWCRDRSDGSSLVTFQRAEAHDEAGVRSHLLAHAQAAYRARHVTDGPLWAAPAAFAPGGPATVDDVLDRLAHEGLALAVYARKAGPEVLIGAVGTGTRRMSAELRWLVADFAQLLEARARGLPPPECRVGYRCRKPAQTVALAIPAPLPACDEHAQAWIREARYPASVAEGIELPTPWQPSPAPARTGTDRGRRVPYPAMTRTAGQLAGNGVHER